MKLLDHIPAAEIVAHRVIWSVPIAGLILVSMGRTADLRAALLNPRMLAMGVLTAALISLNWGIYVWAISSGHTRCRFRLLHQSTLQYCTRRCIFGRAAKPFANVAIVLAIAAVIVLTVSAGKVPWVAIGLFVSWGFYALCKKQLPVGPNQGFCLKF